MKPLLDETMVIWSSKVHPPTEDTTTTLLSVSGTYQGISYTGYAEVIIGDSDDTFKNVAHLKAGITNLIVNTLDEEEMEKRAVFKLSPVEFIPDAEDPYPTLERKMGRRMQGVLDHDAETMLHTAFWAWEHNVKEIEDGSEELDEAVRKAKMLMWTEWRQRELV